MGWIRECLRAIVEEKRNEEKFTQKRLAERIGVSPEMVSLVLNGKRGLSEKTIIEMTRALGLTLSDLESMHFGRGNWRLIRIRRLAESLIEANDLAALEKAESDLRYYVIRATGSVPVLPPKKASLESSGLRTGKRAKGGGGPRLA